MEVDSRELPLAIDFLTVDTHDLEMIRTEERRDAEVRRPLHPGLEEERTMKIEQPIDGAARFGIGEGRAAPFDAFPDESGAARSGEGRLDDPGRRRFAEDAV